MRTYIETQYFYDSSSDEGDFAPDIGEIGEDPDPGRFDTGDVFPNAGTLTGGVSGRDKDLCDRVERTKPWFWSFSPAKTACWLIEKIKGPNAIQNGVQKDVWGDQIKPPIKPMDKISNLRADNPVTIVQIYWLITDTQGRYPIDKVDQYDLILTTSSIQLMSIYEITQQGDGQWVTRPETEDPFTVYLVNGKNLTLTHDHMERVNDEDAFTYFEWIAPEKTIRYEVTFAYESNQVIDFESITFPSDCLIYRDKLDHPGGGIGENGTGATEAFWDSNQINDKTITIDQRLLNEWNPQNHHSVEVRVPAWNVAGQNVLTSVKLRNALAVSNTILFGNTPHTFASEEEKTITGTVFLTNGPDNCRRGTRILDPFVNAVGQNGFTALTEFTTTVPVGIRRTEFTAREACVEAWRLEQGNANPITIDEAMTGESFASSAFGNRPGFDQSRVIIKCRIWLASWKSFSMLENGPPINLQFSGDIRVSSSLTQAMTSNGKLYKNPYDGDAAKIGLATIQNGFLGILPDISEYQVIEFYISRDLLTNNTMRMSKIITLN